MVLLGSLWLTPILHLSKTYLKSSCLATLGGPWAVLVMAQAQIFPKLIPLVGPCILPQCI